MKQTLSTIHNLHSRRQFLKAAGGFGLTAAGMALLSGCGSPAATREPVSDTLETTKITFAQSPSLCTAPQLIAEDLLRAEGFTEIKYDRIPTNLVVNTLTSGNADITMQFSGPLITRLDTNEPIVVLAGVHIGCFELFASETVHTILDLKGKSLAIVEFNGPDHVFLSSMAAYVGLDPTKDINWITQPVPETKQLFADGKIDGFLAFPPTSQDLRAKKIGRLVVNSMVDKPWSQYFCCMITANRDFVTKNPVATKRAVRALLKGTDLCALYPEKAAKLLVDEKYTDSYDYALDAMQHIPYNRWRDYDPTDTLRFYSLRLHEAGMIKSSPEDIIARGADWRYLNEIKQEIPKAAWTPAKTTFICDVSSGSSVNKT